MTILQVTRCVYALNTLCVVDIDCFRMGIKIQRGLPLFFEGVGTRLLEATERSIESEVRCGFVDLHYTCIHLIRACYELLEMVNSWNDQEILSK